MGRLQSGMEEVITVLYSFHPYDFPAYQKEELMEKSLQEMNLLDDYLFIIIT